MADGKDDDKRSGKKWVQL